MRLGTGIVLATLLAATLAPLAAAHTGHASCTTRDTPVGGTLLHLDVANRPCLGAVVYSPALFCSNLADVHPVVGVHVLVLWGGHCNVGVVVEELP